MSIPTCPTHPGSHVRRYRVHGPDGPGVYPQCVPSNGDDPHLLSWADERRSSHQGIAEIVVANELAASWSLSPSELEVLCAAANGLTSTESGRRLRKGVETIKTQRHQIFLKLGARNITHAVCIATEQGYLVAEKRTGRGLRAA